jgi:hypothetical protein
LPTPSVTGAEHVNQDDEWRCGACGDLHRGLVYAFATEAPDAWVALPWWKRGRRSELTGETCVLRGEHFFIRGLIEIPVHGGEEPVFAWNVWSSLSPANFERAIARWNDPDRANEPSYFGWLSVELKPIYPATTNLKLHVATRELGTRPHFEVEPTNHPLAVEQRAGISLARVREINEVLIHRA